MTPPLPSPSSSSLVVFVFLRLKKTIFTIIIDGADFRTRCEIYLLLRRQWQLAMLMILLMYSRDGGNGVIAHSMTTIITIGGDCYDGE